MRTDLVIQTMNLTPQAVQRLLIVRLERGLALPLQLAQLCDLTDTCLCPVTPWCSWTSIPSDWQSAGSRRSLFICDNPWTRSSLTSFAISRS